MTLKPTCIAQLHVERVSGVNKGGDAQLGNFYARSGETRAVGNGLQGDAGNFLRPRNNLSQIAQTKLLFFSASGR